MPPRPAASRATRSAAAATTRAFLFSDLRGYTDYVERRGDAAAARLLRDYRSLVRREVARHAGAEVKTEGDSFYVVFDSASAAVECAVQVQRRAAARNEKDPEAPLSVGIGIHAGDTVAFDSQFVGSAVNIAARLASQAGAGEVVVSDTVRGLVRTSSGYALRERGELALKGVSESVRAWTVAWRTGDGDGDAPAPAMPLLGSAAAPRAPAAGQLLCPVVVGRDGERERALVLVAEALAGRGQTVVIGGEAGVGKSAFVREVVAAAADRGFRPLYGATLEADGGLPYAPFVAAIRSGFRGLEPERLGKVLAQAAPDLAELFPELGRAQRGGAAADQPRLSYAFASLFATFAREAPVVVTIEDVHWADEASLALLQYLARELRDARVLLVATYRSDEMHRRHPFLRVLASLARERLATEVALRRLDPEQVRELIRATFAARDPRVTVGDAFRDAIYARSEGNPFFTEELLKSLVESGDVYVSAETGWERKPLEELQIPGSIKEAVRQRVEALSAEARATVAVAAVIGLQFTFETLREARGLDEAALEAHLREAMEGQLILEHGDGERYGFRHALSKEVVYDDLMVRERKRLHRAVADALAREPHVEPALLAHHLLAAGDTERALPRLLEAGDRAARTAAPREAAAHYGRAVEVGLPEADLPAVLERMAEAYHRFDQTLTLRTAEEALALHRERGDTRGASRMLRLAGRADFYQSRFDRAVERTTEAIEVLGGEECAELARATAQLAGILMAHGRRDEARPLAARALDLGRRLGDPWTLAHAKVTHASLVPDPTEALALFAEANAYAVSEGIVEAALRGFNNRLLRQFPAATPLEERNARIEEGLVYGRRHGMEEASLAYLLSQQAFSAFLEGDWPRAEELARQVAEETQVHYWTVSVLHRMAAAREGPEGARRHLEELERAGDRRTAGYEFPRLDLATAFLRAGDAPRAQALASEALVGFDRYPAGSARTTERLILAGPASREVVLLSLAMPDDALLAAAEVEAHAVDWPLAPGFPRPLSAAARRLRDGDAAAAAAALDSVEPLARRVGLHEIMAELALRFALAARERDGRLGPEWAGPLARARAFAERVGARWWLDRLAELGA